MAKLDDVWERILSAVEEDIPAVSFNTWIKSINPLELTDEKLIIEVPNDICFGMVDAIYKAHIARALYFIEGKEYNVEIVIEGTHNIKPQKNEPENEFTGTFYSTLNPRYTFDTFVIGNANKFAHAASLAVAESPANIYNPLFIYGGVGLGKTHLMHAIGNHVLKNAPDKKIVYVTSEQFTNELINSIKDDKNEEFRNKYRSIDVLLVDDIQFIGGKERTEEEFFHTFNALHQANKQIVISSDKPPKEMHTFEERVRTRFEWGLIADIQAPDFETRVAILKKKADFENVVISDEILRFIASNIRSNIRELEGAIKKLIAYRGLFNKEITMELVEQVLEDFNIVKATAITPDYIIKTVEKHFNLRENSLRAKLRTKEIAYPRQIAMYIIRELLNTPQKKIASEFGLSDHSTVNHGIKKIQSQIDTDITVKNMINDIIKNIKKQ